MTNLPVNYMTVEDCQVKHKIIIWVTGVTLLFLGLLSTLTTISWQASAQASSRADAAVHALEVYREGMNRDIQYLNTVLGEVRGDVREIKTSINALSRHMNGPPQKP
jgi:hypothetical protein